ncbi:Trafficking protein particle complex subunit 2 [Blomia tropicalis]|nr:Trafficking protein particle complex subunit 2 [Blomia tropicalis]
MSSSGYSYYFVIVGKSDNPLFELEYSTKGSASERNVDHRYLTQFVAHATLDLVDEYIWTIPKMFLNGVDKFNDWFVTAFVGGNSRVRFLLLHDAQRIDDNNIKNFFLEMYELYCKFALNPLYIHHTPIKSKDLR